MRIPCRLQSVGSWPIGSHRDGRHRRWRFWLDLQAPLDDPAPPTGMAMFHFCCGFAQSKQTSMELGLVPLVDSLQSPDGHFVFDKHHADVVRGIDTPRFEIGGMGRQHGHRHAMFFGPAIGRLLFAADPDDHLPQPARLAKFLNPLNDLRGVTVQLLHEGVRGGIPSVDAHIVPAGIPRRLVFDGFQRWQRLACVRAAGWLGGEPLRRNENQRRQQNN